MQFDLASYCIRGAAPCTIIGDSYRAPVARRARDIWDLSDGRTGTATGEGKMDQHFPAGALEREDKLAARFGLGGSPVGAQP